MVEAEIKSSLFFIEGVILKIKYPKIHSSNTTNMYGVQNPIAEEKPNIEIIPKCTLPLKRMTVMESNWINNPRKYNFNFIVLSKKKAV